MFRKSFFLAAYASLSLISSTVIATPLGYQLECHNSHQQVAHIHLDMETMLGTTAIYSGSIELKKTRSDSRSDIFATQCLRLNEKSQRLERASNNELPAPMIKGCNKGISLDVSLPTRASFGSVRAFAGSGVFSVFLDRCWLKGGEL